MRTTRGRGVRLLALIASIGLLLGLPATAGHAADLAGNKSYSAYAHDVKAYVLSTGAVSAGPVVAAGVGCSDRAPLFFQDQGVGVSLAGVNLGTVTTSSGGFKSGTVQESRSVFQAQGVSIPILTASLTADSIVVTSSTFFDTATGEFTTSSTMTVANLTIRATPVGPTLVQITGAVSPNFGVNIPGVAQVLLHRSAQVGTQAGGAVGQASDAIRLELLGGTASTRVGETYSSLYGETDQTWMFGEGQALTVSALDAALRVGPLVTAQLPCTGNGGVTSNVVGVGGLPAALGAVGAVESTSTGARSGLTADAATTSEVAGVNLLDGLVTATAIKSTSQVSTVDGAQLVSKAGSGSTLTNLVVAGQAIDVNAAPNTVINLPAGLGYVVINAQNQFDAGIEVIPLVVHVNATNLDVIVARSYAVLLGPETSAAAMKQAQKFLKKEVTKAERLELDQRVLTDGTLKKARVLPAP